MKILPLFRSPILGFLVWLISTGAIGWSKTAQPRLLQNFVPDNIIHVPGEVSDLQQAINQISNGGIIELAAGTYSVPSGGFRINDMGKSFTLRAASGAQVTIDGGGAQPLIRLINSDPSKGGPIVFQRLTFANGKSSTPGLAGGVTIMRSEATFIDCNFINNTATNSGTGGGTLVAINSRAFFFNVSWINNTAMDHGGGLVIADNSKVYVHNSLFRGNRVDLPGHSPSAAGGGIHMGNSILRVSNTRFENNQAGYVGGALYAIGTWTDPVTTPRAEVIVINSTFINNHAQNDPSVNLSVPTEGGAFHAEDQIIAKIYNSRFITNSAMAGGGVNLYRAEVIVENSVFQGNQAIGTGSKGGFGGAISAISNDTPADGDINRRPASLILRNSLIQGRYGNVAIVAQVGGGLYAAGDFNRTYGANGVSKKGSVTDNRAHVLIDNVVFNDLDVQSTIEDGVGGGILVDLSDLTLQNSLIVNSDAIGPNNSSGGGLAVINQSRLNATNLVLARNTSQKYGGAFFAQGSETYISDCYLFDNILYNTNYGAAIFTTVADGYSLPALGTVQNCLISNNTGQAIFDDDRTNGPINEVRYNNNQVYAGGVNAIIYSDSIYPYGSKTTAQLNDLIVRRANGTSTDKSTVPNLALGDKPSIGRLLAVPIYTLPFNAQSDPPAPTNVYLAYAWSGGSATLDGLPLQSNAGVVTTTQDGVHTLVVDGQTYNVIVGKANIPSATFSVFVTEARTTLFSWSVSSATFLDVAIDQGVETPSNSAGSASLPFYLERDYHFYAITQEGGIVKTGSPIPLSLPYKVFLPSLAR